MNIGDQIKSLVDVAEKEFGPVVFEYTKTFHHWNPPSRKPRREGCYTVCVSSPDPVITKEEYDAGVEQGKRDATQAFFRKEKEHGKSYYTFNRKVKEWGWLGVVKAELEKLADEKESHETHCGDSK